MTKFAHTPCSVTDPPRGAHEANLLLGVVYLSRVIDPNWLPWFTLKPRRWRMVVDEDTVLDLPIVLHGGCETCSWPP